MSVPQIGSPAPEFVGSAVVNGEIKEIKLSDYKGKWVLLFFYPLDFTFVCPTEIIAYSDANAKFAELDTVLIGASVDSVYTHMAWINTPRKDGGLGSINIPLLADVNHKISEQYGVLFQNSGHTLRGNFLIDPKGVLRQVTLNEPPVGRSVDESLRLVEAFRFVDEHGEVCPANWQKGGDTINTADAKKYFNKHG